MKYFSYLKSFLSILILASVLIPENESTLWVVCALGILLLTASVLTTIKGIQMSADLAFDYRFRMNKWIIPLRTWLYSPVLIILYYSLKKSQPLITFVSVFGIFLISNLIGHVLIRYLKPYMLIVKGDVLKINDLIRVEELKLTGVVKFGFSLRHTRLHLYFEDRDNISFSLNEFSLEDIEQLIDITIDKSEHELERPPNYIKYRNNLLKYKHSYGSKI